MTNDAAYYATPAPMTDTTVVGDPAFAGMPTDVLGICSIAKHLMVHEFLVDRYDVTITPDRTEEIEQRSFVELASTILGRCERPLVEPRTPSERTIGNCRHYSVITTALLRRVGHPARARGGFANYFDPQTWTDHWIIEYWDSARQWWVRADTQIDDTQRDLFAIDFDPLDLPEGRFLAGAEAWQRCRAGDDDPGRYGIADMHGEWFIAGSLIRDLASLNKIEPHTWDVWGTISELAYRDLTEAERQRLDHIAAIVTADHRPDLATLHQTPGLHPSDPIVSARTQRTVHYPTEPLRNST